jgi:hypothetical protein
MSEKMPNLAETCRSQIESVEQEIADLLLDFTQRTGFVFKSANLIYRAPYGGEADYALRLEVDIWAK